MFGDKGATALAAALEVDRCIAPCSLMAYLFFFMPRDDATIRSRLRHSLLAAKAFTSADASDAYYSDADAGRVR
jgi:hypothetical protein